MLRAMRASRVAVAISRRSRRRKLELFVRTVQPAADSTILDVGVEDGAPGDGSVFATANFIEQGWPAGHLTAVGLHEGRAFSEAYPHVPYVQADGRHLPFGDATFDAVLCNAVIEHVGDLASQRALVDECCRVGKIVILTTPDRRFPIEQHTYLPLIHWLPERLYRPLLRRVAADRVGDIRLLTPRQLARMFPSDRDVAVLQRGMSVVVAASSARPSGAIV
jgi:SAM-dependent methyltransferase